MVLHWLSAVLVNFSDISVLLAKMGDGGGCGNIIAFSHTY